MNDESYVGLVDSHTKGNRCHHDVDFVADKSLLISLSHWCRESRVICGSFKAILCKLLRDLISIAAGKAIYDHALAFVFAE